jgi:putative spermidine/putrescine transport system substrate-binding protein
MADASAVALTTNKMEVRTYDEKKSNSVQKTTLCLVVLFFVSLIIIMGVASATYDVVADLAQPAPISSYGSLGLPGYEGYNWDDVLSGAAGGEVRFNTWNGSESINSWINDWLAPQLAEFDITLTLVPLKSTYDAVDTVIEEVEADKNADGSIDLIWLNGNNFYLMKSGGYAYGPWSDIVPSADLYDWSDYSISHDFGYAVDGYEMPYTGAQVVFVRCTNHVSASAVNTYDNFITWLQGSGNQKFTYPAPCYILDSDGSCEKGDYTGAVFIRHVLYHVLYDNGADYSVFESVSVDESLYAKWAPKLFKKLRDLEASLYADATDINLVNDIYPKNITVQDALFDAMTLYMTLSYNPNAASDSIGTTYPATAQGFVFNDTIGTIANTNYVLIPSNSPNKLAALVAGNLIGSAPAMFSRAKVKFLSQVYNPESDAFTSGGWDAPFELMDTSSADPTTEVLRENRADEIGTKYSERFTVDWYWCVQNYVAGRSTVTLDDESKYTVYCD